LTNTCLSPVRTSWERLPGALAGLHSRRGRFFWLVWKWAEFPWPRRFRLKTGLPQIFVRKEAKTYGTCKLAEGIDFKEKKVTVVEDVVTTGGAILDGVRALREQGALIETVLCVIDRESGGSDNLKKAGTDVGPSF
jgi:phosphoribosylpyrophosphate synthetase